MTKRRALGAAAALLVGAAAAASAVACNGLLGLEGYRESACFPEASCPEGGFDATTSDVSDASMDTGLVETGSVEAGPVDSGHVPADAEGGTPVDGGCAPGTVNCRGMCYLRGAIQRRAAMAVAGALSLGRPATRTTRSPPAYADMARPHACSATLGRPASVFRTEALVSKVVAQKQTTEIWQYAPAEFPPAFPGMATFVPKPQPKS